jgi:POLQ-like helicase
MAVYTVLFTPSEFNVANELHFDLGESDPSHLFPLVVGILGEEASRIGDLDLDKRTVTPRIVPEDTFALRFSAAFLHAYVTSRFGGDLASEFLLLSAAAYYLCDLAGSASVLLHEARQTGPSKDDWDTLLRWLIAADWSQAPRFDNGTYSQHQSSLVANLVAHFADGTSLNRIWGAKKRFESYERAVCA